MVTVGYERCKPMLTKRFDLEGGEDEQAQEL